MINAEGGPGLMELKLDEWCMGWLVLTRKAGAEKELGPREPVRYFADTKAMCFYIDRSVELMLFETSAFVHWTLLDVEGNWIFSEACRPSALVVGQSIVAVKALRGPASPKA